MIFAAGEQMHGLAPQSLQEHRYRHKDTGNSHKQPGAQLVDHDGKDHQDLCQNGQQRTVNAVLNVAPCGDWIDVLLDAGFILTLEQRTDHQQIHQRTDGERNGCALQVHQGEVMHSVVRSFTVEEVAGKGSDAVHSVVGQAAQAAHQQNVAAQNDGGRSCDILAVAMEVLVLGILFYEDADEQLQHICEGQAAGEEECPLQSGKHPGILLQQNDVLHDALVQQSLADIAVQQRQTGQAQHGDAGQNSKQRFAAAETLNIVQVIGMSRKMDDTRNREQHHLDQRMVQDVQDGTVHSQCVVMAQEALHCKADHDKADLRNGRASQGAFQVHGANGQCCTQHHGNGADDSQHAAPGAVMQEQRGGQDGNTVNAGLSDHTGQHGRCGRRSCGVGCRQPDMQRERTCLGREAKQRQDAGQPETAGIADAFCGMCQLGDLQGTQQIVDQEQTVQRHQATNHSHSQIGAAGTHSVLLLCLDNEDVGGKGHDLEADKGGEEICGEEHAHSCAKGQHPEHVVTVAALDVREILQRQNGCGKPAGGGQKGHQGVEAAGLEADAETAETGNLHGNMAAGNHNDGCDQLQCRCQNDKSITHLLAAATDQIADRTAEHGKHD